MTSVISERNPTLLDPSQLLRPELNFADKEISKFRDYSLDKCDPIKERVRKFYRQLHENQTVDFVMRKLLALDFSLTKFSYIFLFKIGQREKWLKFNHYEGTIREALEKLNEIVDESDPDINLPNIIHGFQSAERAREEYPELDWLHLTALIHDLGKIMTFFGEPQYAVTGDTYPVGCKWSDNIVYRETSFEGNPDADDPKYK